MNFFRYGRFVDHGVQIEVFQKISKIHYHFSKHRKKELLFCFFVSVLQGEAGQPGPAGVKGEKGLKGEIGKRGKMVSDNKIMR